MEPVLQVALDFMHLKRALQAADEAVAGGADWVEAGTPLIKSEGVDAVRALRKRFPRHTVVADMKIMDTGAFEVEIAAEGGVVVGGVLAASDDATVAEAVKAARRYGAKVMADLIGCDDMPSRAKQVQALGVDYLCVHVSIDEQMIARTPLRRLEQVVRVAKVPVAVAGGLNSETVAQALKAGAPILIVGGALIKAPDVKRATAALKAAMKRRRAVRTQLYKKYAEKDLAAAFSRVSTPNIADAAQKRGVLRGILPRNGHGVRLVGRALTVKTADGDLAPVVVLAFPCFSRHVVPVAGEPKGHGEIGPEIECGGQTVRTGDWIIGDESGVVVVPQESAVEIANRALDVLERENRLREEIRRGATLSSVLELEKWEKVG